MKKFLVSIIVLAAVLRFVGLGTNPPSLAWDEAAWGYNAYSLGLTGQDEWGRFLPWNYLESFGDFKPPLYAYLSILPVKLFGLSEFSTRFASAFLGVGTVVATYYLVGLLFSGRKNVKLIALLSALFMAVSPWHILLSRGAFEANVGSFLLITGVIFFFRSLEKKGYNLVVSFVLFALGINTFNTTRIFVPVLVVILMAIFHKKVWNNKRWLSGAVIAGAILFLPLVPFLLSPQAKLRFREVNIFSDTSVVTLANQEIDNDGNAWWSYLIHNRRVLYFQSFVRHYFDNLNPSFLFYRGDGNPKFSTRDTGQLYWLDLPFLLAGCVILILSKSPSAWFLVLWLILGIVPAATARETPHALRIETTLPVWQIITALGVTGVYEWWKRKDFPAVIRKGYLLFFPLLFLSVMVFQHSYWRHYAVDYSGEWQWGYKQVVELVRDKGGDYDEIWVTDKIGRPYIYFLFYLKENPEIFRQSVRVDRNPYGFVNVTGYGKYNFFGGGVNPLRSKLNPHNEKKILIVDCPENTPNSANVIKRISLLNGEETLVAYED